MREREAGKLSTRQLCGLLRESGSEATLCPHFQCTGVEVLRTSFLILSAFNPRLISWIRACYAYL